jgi:hypothetical protein
MKSGYRQEIEITNELVWIEFENGHRVGFHCRLQEGTSGPSQHLRQAGLVGEPGEFEL